MNKTLVIMFANLLFMSVSCYCAELKLHDGGKYTGEVANNSANGKGTASYPDGTVEEGYFINGYLVKGKVTTTDGSYSEGYFKDGRLIEGTRDFEGNWTETGEFDENNQLIKGKVTYSDGSTEEGEFRNGYLYKGKSTDGAGLVQEGEFDRGVLVKPEKSSNESTL